MIDARERFQKSQHIVGWADLVESDRFKHAAEAAMFTLFNQLKATWPDKPEYWGYALRGAHMLLDELIALVPKEPTRRKPITENLNHQV